MIRSDDVKICDCCGRCIDDEAAYRVDPENGNIHICVECWKGFDENQYEQERELFKQKVSNRYNLVRIDDEAEFWAEFENEPRNSLAESMAKTFKGCLELSKAKNADYAGNDDPLANFRACQRFGVSIEEGILVRLSDKIARLERLLGGIEPHVKEERIVDTIDDAINYLAILKFAWLEDV